jgi:MFS family permease
MVNLRILVLGGYVLLAFLQGASWSVLANLPDATRSLFPGLTNVELALAIALNSACQGIAVPLATWLLSRPNGMRLTVVAAALCTALQSSSWLIASVMPLSFRRSVFARLAIYFGASVGGVGCCFVEGSPSAVSALWFPLAERGRATAAAYIATFLGNAIGFLVCMTINDQDGLVVLELWQTGLIVLVFHVSLFWFPSDARSASAVGAASERLLSDCAQGDICVATSAGDAVGEATAPAAPDLTVLQGLKACASNPSCMLLVVACSIVNGAYVAWQSLMPILFSAMPAYDSHDGDLFGFSSGICYCLGGYLSGEIGDRYFAGRLQPMLMLVYGAAVANFAVLLFVMPSPFSQTIGAGYGAVATAISTTGFFVGATMPPSLELLAEVAYPVSEGTTANLVQALNMISLTSLTAVLPLVPSDYCNAVVGGTVMFCAMCSGLVRKSSSNRRLEVGVGEC